MTDGRRADTMGRPRRTLVLDNGSNTIKAGFVMGDSAVNEPQVIPNCIARDRDKKIYVGSELANCRQFGELQIRRPMEKSFIVNWEAQSAIWENEFFDDKAPLHCDASDTRLVLAEAPNCLSVLQSHCDQMVFEEFGFASYCRALGPTLNAYNDIQAILNIDRAKCTAVELPAEIMLVIDSGFSNTTITPVLRGRALHPAVRRVDVGGKLLTNQLTRLMSMRHYDMRSDYYIVNEMKEKVCFVSMDFASDLQKCWKGARGEAKQQALFTAGSEGLAIDYVLPDFHTRNTGEIRPYDAAHAAAWSRARRLGAETNEDVLTLRSERFTVPEILFNPGDLGLSQPSIPDAVMQSLDVLPAGLWPGLLANIIVVGGNSLLEGFIPRLQSEIGSRAPDDCLIRIARPENPITTTWHGAVSFARHEHCTQLEVSKAEYEENGAGWVARKFAAGLGLDK